MSVSKPKALEIGKICTSGDQVVAIPKDKFDEFKVQGLVSPTRFQRCSNEGTHIIIKLKERISAEDQCWINFHCDAHEGSKNKDIKAIFAGALTQHFSKAAGGYQLVELGAGAFPLIESVMLKDQKIDYHAIDIDPAIVANLKSRGYSASTPRDIPEGTLRTDVPRVADGVYMMHFLDPEEGAEDIKRIISQDGFFVGNYMTAYKKDQPEHFKALLRFCKEEGLNVSILRQKESRNTHASNSNLNSEFWVISHPSAKNGFKSAGEKFAETLYYYLNKALPNDGWQAQVKHQAMRINTPTDRDRSSQSQPSDLMPR